LEGRQIFVKVARNQISRKSVQWVPRSYMRIGGRTDGRTDAMNFKGAFHYLCESASGKLWALHACASVCQFHRRKH